MVLDEHSGIPVELLLVREHARRLFVDERSDVAVILNALILVVAGVAARIIRVGVHIALLLVIGAGLQPITRPIILVNEAKLGRRLIIARCTGEDLSELLGRRDV